MRSFVYLTTTWCLLAFATPLQAARKARVIFIQAPADAAGKAILFTGTHGIDIELPQRNFSPEVSLPEGDLTLAVLAKVPAKGEAVDKRAPLLHIPAAWSRCLILLFPDSSNQVFPVRAVPLNASLEQFPLGHILVFNVSSAMVAVKLGQQKAQVKPGQNVALNPPMEASGDYLVAIDCAVPGDNESTPLCRSTWHHDPRCRQILLVIPEEGCPVPRVWGAQDHPVPEEKK